MKKSLIYIILSFFIVTIMFCLIIFVVFFRYPLKYTDEINKYSKEFNLKPEIIASVIYAESKFNRNAESRVGAIGLMQIMPKTAIEIANKLTEENFNEEMLFNPEINIKFGCFYLKQLINQFEDLDVAFAAYNAGPNNVKMWLQMQEYSANGKILDKIPFKETEIYVKKINKIITFYAKKFK